MMERLENVNEHDFEVVSSRFLGRSPDVRNSVYWLANLQWTLVMQCLLARAERRGCTFFGL